MSFSSLEVANETCYRPTYYVGGVSLCGELDDVGTSPLLSCKCTVDQMVHTVDGFPHG